MGKVTGFLESQRELPARRSAEERINDWFEIYQDFPNHRVRTQGAHCMESPTTMLPQFVNGLLHGYKRAMDEERINTWCEMYKEFPNDRVRTQGAGCTESLFPHEPTQVMGTASQSAKGEAVHG
jgi:hypothetical protein